jgi:hypothetical protein
MVTAAMLPKPVVDRSNCRNSSLIYNNADSDDGSPIGKASGSRRCTGDGGLSWLHLH